MARPSSVDKLPSDLREWIGRLRQQGCTLDEIIAKLRELDQEAIVSRSALHRHLQKADEIAEKIRETRIIAEAIGRKVGETDDAQLTRSNIELLHSLIMKLQMNIMRAEASGEEGSLETLELMQLAKALDHLGKAAKDDVARTIAIEKRAAEKARHEAVKAVEKTGKEKGWSKDTLEDVKASIFGAVL